MTERENVLCRSSRCSFVFMTIIVLCMYSAVVESLAPPTILSITPSYGPDEGGTEIVIRGRNLAYLNQDVKIFMSTMQIKKQIPEMNIYFLTKSVKGISS